MLLRVRVGTAPPREGLTVLIVGIPEARISDPDHGDPRDC